MAINPRLMLVSSSKYNIKCPYALTPKFIIVHNTANDASAHNEVSYMIGNNAQVSFHYAIDDKEVVQGIPANRNAWQAGDGGSGNGNRNGLSIEICYSKSGGEKFIAAEKLSAKFIAQELKARGWGIDKVKKHQDFSGKYCPHRTLDMGWTRFLNMIKAELTSPVVEPAPAQKPTVTPAPTKVTYRVRKTWAEANSQKGAFTDLANAKKCADQYKLKVYDEKGNQVYPVVSNKKYLNLNPHVANWRIYPTNKPAIVGNEVGKLAPKQFGGLSYEILNTPGTDLYTIQTSSFGRVNIYAPKDKDSSITTSPIYK